MSSEADVEAVRECIGLEEGISGDTQRACDEARAALTRLSDRLQRYEAVVDAAERLLDPPIRVGSERLHGQDNDIGVLRAALNALASPATQETGE